MKIALLATGIVPPWNNGIKNFILEYAINLNKIDNEVEIITSIPNYNSPNYKYFKEEGISIHVFSYKFPHFNRLFMRAFLSSMAMSRGFKYLFSKNKYDILHSHSASAAFAIPIALNTFNLNVKKVHTLHGASFNTSSVINKFGCKALGLYDYIVVASRTLNNKIKVDRRIKIIANGINTEIFLEEAGMRKLYKYNDINSGMFLKESRSQILTIGYIGPLNWIKGFNNFVKLASELVKENLNIRFLVMNSSQNDSIVVEKNLASKIYFTGVVENRQSVISEMDIVIFPYNTITTTILPPLSILEAMCCGKTVVVSDVAGIRDFIIDKNNGFLYPPNNNELLKIIVRELIFDEKIRLIVGVNAQYTALKYDIKEMIKSYEEVYKTL